MCQEKLRRGTREKREMNLRPWVTIHLSKIIPSRLIPVPTYTGYFRHRHLQYVRLVNWSSWASSSTYDAVCVSDVVDFEGAESERVDVIENLKRQSVSRGITQCKTEAEAPSRPISYTISFSRPSEFSPNDIGPMRASRTCGTLLMHLRP